MVGHYDAMCKTKTRGGAANSLGGRKREAEVNKYLEGVDVVGDTDDDDDDDDGDDEALGLFTAEDSKKRRHAPIQVSVMLDQSCEMQLDTGATVSTLPKTLYDQQFNQWPLRSTKVMSKAYNGVQIPVYGEVCLLVVYDQKEGCCRLLHVVDGDGPPKREGSPGNCIWCPEVSQVSIRSNVSPVNRSQAISDHLGS